MTETPEQVIHRRLHELNNQTCDNPPDSWWCVVSAQAVVAALSEPTSEGDVGDSTGMRWKCSSTIEERLYATTDAAVWAEEFVKVCPDVDEGLMIAWFANAIETAKSHEQARIAALEAELEAWRNREPLSPDPERVQLRALVVRNRALEAVVSAARTAYLDLQPEWGTAQQLSDAIAALDATQPEPVTPKNTSVTSNNTSSAEPATETT